jgi:hypothetical protein
VPHQQSGCATSAADIRSCRRCWQRRDAIAGTLDIGARCKWRPAQCTPHGRRAACMCAFLHACLPACMHVWGASAHRSGCGIMARWRPSSEQRAAMPLGDPLGLKGYTSVGRPSASAYRMGARPASSTRCRTASSGKWQRPSPCATQMPSVLPAMPSSITAGDGWMLTCAQRHSNRPARTRACMLGGSAARRMHGAGSRRVGEDAAGGQQGGQSISKASRSIAAAATVSTSGASRVWPSTQVRR